MLISDISNRINQIFPLSEGQNDWDNIGVLIDTGSSSKKVLLTIDITDSVIEECIRKDIKNIISYHPVIFQGIKKINKDDLVRKLIRNDINVFSPHTSWDKEMNEYIKNILEKKSVVDINTMIKDEESVVERIIKTLKEKTGNKYLRVAGNTSNNNSSNINNSNNSSNINNSSNSNNNNTINNSSNNISNNNSSKNIVVGVGAAFRYHNYKNSIIVTGEMSHHCLLHSIKNGNTVILLEHSNSERITLPHMKKRIEGILEDCIIEISEEDRDPNEIK